MVFLYIVFPLWLCVQGRNRDLHIDVRAFEFFLELKALDVGTGSSWEEVFPHGQLPLEVVSDSIRHADVLLSRFVVPIDE